MDKNDLKALRESLKLNQFDFGKKLGFADTRAQAIISDLETGKLSISKRTEIICIYIKKFGLLEL